MRYVSWIHKFRFLAVFFSVGQEMQPSQKPSHSGRCKTTTVIIVTAGNDRANITKTKKRWFPQMIHHPSCAPTQKKQTTPELMGYGRKCARNSIRYAKFAAPMRNDCYHEEVISAKLMLESMRSLSIPSSSTVSKLPIPVCTLWSRVTCPCDHVIDKINS